MAGRPVRGLGGIYGRRAKSYGSPARGFVRLLHSGSKIRCWRSRSPPARARSFLAGSGRKPAPAMTTASVKVLIAGDLLPTVVRASAAVETIWETARPTMVLILISGRAWRSTRAGASRIGNAASSELHALLVER